MNHTNLIGRMTKDPDMKYTANGIAIIRFTLAVERHYKEKSKGRREADFIQFLAWRKQAENIANYCRKGSQVGVSGRIQTSNFEGKDGNRVFMTEVVCEGVQFLSTPKKCTDSKDGFQYNPFAEDSPVDIDPGKLPF